MDEKGSDGIDMDDEPENDGEQEELDTEEMGRDAEAVADAPFRPQVNRAVSEKVAEHGKERMLADSPRCRISVKEKLAEMRERAYGQKIPEKPDISKGKGKRGKFIRRTKWKQQDDTATVRKSIIEQMKPEQKTVPAETKPLETERPPQPKPSMLLLIVL